MVNFKNFKGYFTTGWNPLTDVNIAFGILTEDFFSADLLYILANQLENKTINRKNKLMLLETNCLYVLDNSRYKELESTF